MSTAEPSTINKPAGIVTLMFTDIEGSTELLERLRDEYAVILEQHRDILRGLFTEFGGYEVDTQGDSFFVVFGDPDAALACALEIQRACASHTWPDQAEVRVRIGLHTGSVVPAGSGFVGIDVHRAARIGNAAHGGQVVVSDATYRALGQLERDCTAATLGTHRFKGLADPIAVWQVNAPGLVDDFPPLRISQPEDEPPAPGESPYRGLLHFDETDADRFFGRETLVDQIVAALRETSFLAIIGASGSGKSSLLRAGVLPGIRRAGWQSVVLTPTDDPVAALEESLAKVHKPDLVVVDQFEELFTLCREEARRQQFLGQLTRLRADGARVLISLRADFYAELARYPELRDLVADDQLYIGPMSVDELRRAIDLPASLGGWEIAPGLVDLLLRDTGDEPGGLPLLSHALLETWQHRRGNRLTLKSYFESGEIRGAIGRTADRVYGDLPPEQQQTVRQLLLRLTELGEGTQDTRRRAPLAELASLRGGIASFNVVLQQLVDARLVTVNEEWAEVAHEALIREWPLLREWLREDRDGLRTQRVLTEAATEWLALDREPSMLFRGARLATAREWCVKNGEALTDQEREFVQASVDAEALAERERSERQARELEAAQRAAEAERLRAEDQASANRRLRRRAVILAVALVLAAGLGVIAVVFARTASDQSTEAQRQARVALSRQLAAGSIATRSQPDLSVLLAIAGNQTDDSPESRDAVLSALLNQPALIGYLPRGSENPSVLSIGDGSLVAVTSENGRVTVWNPAARSEPVFSVNGTAVAASADGKRLLTGGDDGHLREWDVPTGRLTADLPGDGNAIEWITYASERAAASQESDGSLVFWNLDDGTHSSAADPAHVLSFASTPDGRTFARASRADIELWVGPSQQMKAKVDLPCRLLWPSSMALSDDGTRLILGCLEGTAIVIDVTTGSVVGEHPLAGAYMPSAVAVSAASQLVAVGDFSGGITFYPLDGWVARTGTHIATTDPVYSLAFSADGSTLVAASSAGTTTIWDVNTAMSGPEIPDKGILHAIPLTNGGSVMSIATSRAGAIAYAAQDGFVQARANESEPPIVTASLPVVLSADEVQVSPLVALSPDGSRLAAAGPNGVVDLFDMQTGEKLDTTLEIGVDPTTIDDDTTDNVGAFNSIGFTPDAGELVAGTSHGTAVVWPVDAKRPRARPSRVLQVGDIGRAALSPDGKTLATISTADPRVDLWDFDTGSHLAALESTGLEPGNQLAFSPDGTVLAASAGPSIVLWNVASRTASKTLTVPDATWLALAFSPDGTTIASIGSGIVLWDAASGRIAGVLPDGFGLAFTPDGERIATGTIGTGIQLWDATVDRWSSAGCAFVNRDLTEAEWTRYYGDVAYRATCP